MGYTIQDVQTIQREALSKFSQSSDSWKNYCKSAAYTYKYSFPATAVLAYAKPEAKAVAPFNIWSKKLNSKINKGAKGIPLISLKTGGINVVFDIADTNSKIKIWQPIKDMTSMDVLKRVNAKIGDYKSTPLDTFIRNSAAIITCERCGATPPPNVDFSYVQTLTEEQLMKIGAEINRLARSVLRDIENEAKLEKDRTSNIEKDIPSTAAETAEQEKIEPKIPIYDGKWTIADDGDLYYKIVAENERFAKMANEVIGNGKNPADSVKILTEEFGMERTAFLTALNIVAHPMDGRFYPMDKEWACKVLAPYIDVQPDEIINRTPEKQQIFEQMVNGGTLYSIHNTHLAQLAETLIPEYEKYLDKARVEEKTAETTVNQSVGEQQELDLSGVRSVSGLIGRSEKEIEILTNSLMLGTGVENGKFRTQEFFEREQPDTKAFVDYLKKEYGTGGRSESGDVKFSSHDSKGIQFELTNGNKINFTWSEVAKRLTELITANEYITDKDVTARIRRAKYEVENYANATPGSYTDIRYNEALMVLQKYGILDKEPEKTAVDDSLQADIKEHKDIYFKDTAQEENGIIFDARKKKFENMHLHFDEDGAYKLLADNDGNKDLILRVFKSENEILAYINEANLVVDERKAIAAERNAVDEFRAKTDEMFHAIGTWTPENIEQYVTEYVENILDESSIDYEKGSIKAVLNGSYARGMENHSSDIDVVVEIDTKEREDSLFNLLNEGELTLPERKYADIPIDINPITPYETGSLETYLPKAEEYLENKRETLDKAKELINEFCQNEYDQAADFSDISRIEIAYTTDEETEAPIQVYADLVKKAIITEYDNEIIRAEIYSSLEDMCDKCLPNLDFSELVAVSDEEKTPYREDVIDEMPTKIKDDIDEDISDSNDIKQKFENGTLIASKIIDFQNGDQYWHDSYELVKNGDEFFCEFQQGYDNEYHYSQYSTEEVKEILDEIKNDNTTKWELSKYGKNFANADEIISAIQDGTLVAECNIDHVAYGKINWQLYENSGSYYLKHTDEVDYIESAYFKYGFEDLKILTESYRGTINYTDYGKEKLSELGLYRDVKEEFEYLVSQLPDDSVSHYRYSPEEERFYEEYHNPNGGKSEYGQFEQQSFGLDVVKGAYEYYLEKDKDIDAFYDYINSYCDNYADPDEFVNVTAKTNEHIQNFIDEVGDVDVNVVDLMNPYQQNEMLAFMLEKIGIEREAPKQAKVEDPDTYRIYQLKDNEQYRFIRFTSLEDNRDHGTEPKKAFYDLIYKGKLSDIKGDTINQKLENIYEMFNIDTPDDFKGHSLSMSDVVTVGNDENEKAYYVDDIGFAELPDFEKGKTEPITENTQFSEEETVADNTEQEPVTKQKAVNYRITNDNIGVGTPKERYKRNIEAIKTLKNIEKDDRQATSEEQEILAQYVGWGGLSEVFDETNASWKSEGEELKWLLTDSEYLAARASTTSSFYTQPMIVNAIYDTISEMGFKGGKVLEPSCGVGNFLGSMPEEMAKNSKIYGVELDSITGRIAKLLYPKSKIQVKGFENTAFGSNSFDLAVGNVPFGSVKVSDINFKHEYIHDYFFKNALDKVRPGGIVAFITSKGTLDKADISTRKYLAERADLLGAVRLPNTAFKRAAGTEVVSDIIFLQKREELRDLSVDRPSWIEVGDVSDEVKNKSRFGRYANVRLNNYFNEHPENVVGELEITSSRYGYDLNCVDNGDFENTLKQALSNIKGNYVEEEIEEEEVFAEDIENDYPVEDYRNYCFHEIEGKIYYRDGNELLNRTPENTKKAERIKGMIKIADALQDVIDTQLECRSDNEIKAAQEKLNIIYDDFTKKNGLINSSANRIFEDDSRYPLLMSLEILNEQGELEQKADIFTERTIKAYTPIEHVNTASEALIVSISERAKVDLDYMSDLCGKEKDEIVKDLEGVIFKEPIFGRYETADEYLSGNVRDKLRIAEKYASDDPEFKINVKALSEVMPKDLTAGEITAQLGATWIPTKYYNQFMYETLGTPERHRESYLWRKKDKNPFLTGRGGESETIMVGYSEAAASFAISNKTVDYNNVKVNTTYGTNRMNAYAILEATLNQKPISIVDYLEMPDGKKRAVPNQKETILAQAKQQDLKEMFAKWIYADHERTDEICRIYNDRFNSIVPRNYDGSHLVFGGMNMDIKLRDHQKDAIARTLYGGNSLLAHSVGAGKTFEICASAMEGKRLGLHSKSLIAVPKAIAGQFAREFLQLYPAANILVPTKNDFKPENRKRFCSKIATGNYDAIIISHNQLEKLPLSAEKQQEFLNAELTEARNVLEELRAQGEKGFGVKSIETAISNMSDKYEELLNSPKDDTVTFEQLGVDKLYVDEAHLFKNLFFTSKMGRNVAGINANSEVKRATDLFMKVRYLDEITDSKGTVFSTGTPVSNSMSELYVMQKYLQNSKLKSMGLGSFDSWASNFGEAVTAMELAPEGKGFQMKTRFNKFFNLPELMSLFKECADIKTKDMLNLPLPKAYFHTVSTEASAIQRQMVNDLAERARRIRNRQVTPDVDNMLNITNDGKKLAIDQRLKDPLAEDDKNSKVNVCVQNVFEIWDKTKAEKSTQIIFSDLSTPKGDGSFNIYDDIKKKLMDKGIPENEIAFIHSAANDEQKKKMLEKVNCGEIRVLLGSTSKLGTGVNCQKLLKAVHHIDCPWKPADLEQRNGRIIRQGNTNPEVDIYNYVTKGTLDSFLYQVLEKKQGFISQVMTSKSPQRVAEDIDDTQISFATMKSIAMDNPLFAEKMQLEIDIQKLMAVYSAYTNEQRTLQTKITKDFPEQIKMCTERIEGLKADLATARQHKSEKFEGMTVNGITYTSEQKKNAGEAIIEAAKKVNALECEDIKIGTYKGFDLLVGYDRMKNMRELTLRGKRSHTVLMGTDANGNITRLDNMLDNIDKELATAENKLTEYNNNLETAKAELGKPFAKADELKQMTDRLKEVDEKIDSYVNEDKDKEKEKQQDDMDR